MSRLAAEDNFSIKGITKSTFIRQSLTRDFPKRTIPKNQSGMMELIQNYYDQVKETIKQRLTVIKQKGGKFSASIDEWTSLKNVRYINVNIHYSIEINKTQHINLGMIKIEGSCPSERMRALVSILN